MCASVFAWAKTDTRAPLERPRYLRGAYIMNHKKLLLTLTLCLCALLCTVVTASASEVQNTGSHSHALCEGLRDNCTDPAHSEGNHGSVTFATELRQVGDKLYIDDNEWTYNNNVGYVLPAGNYYLGTDLTLDHQIRISNSQEVKVTLCLNGKTITCTENYDAVIQTPTTYPVEFTLCDCRPSDSVGKITHANGIRGVGVELNNNNAVNAVAHKFIMYNGCITGNKTTNGAGVFLYSNTTFTMYGGSITENECNSDTYPPCGGGVYVHNGATFTMYGGDITKNQADYGGGVGTSGNAANFTMYGGSITENHANKSGGGIYSTSNNISIYGGGVTNNSVTKTGNAGGIYVSSSGTLTVGGNVNISGNWKGDSEESGSKSNVYLNGNTSGTSAAIVIEKELTGEEPIGVTTANAPTAGNPVTIVTGNSIKEAYKDSFQADNAAYGVSYDDTKKVLQMHAHSGGTATCTEKAVCTTCGQQYGNTNPNHDYSQTKMTPTYKASDATCTTPVTYYYSCVCGATGTNTFNSTKEDEQAKGHAFAAAWEHNDDKHWHKCTRDGCTGIDAEAAHEWQPATYTAPKTCVCGATQGEPLTRSYYYYAPSAAEDKKDSPKTADPGVLLYAGLALASLTGLACTAKKRH